MNIIDQLYAFIITDEDGDEAVPAFRDPSNGMLMPLVGADLGRIDSLMAMASGLAKQKGRQIKICRFSQREQIGEVNP